MVFFKIKGFFFKESKKLENFFGGIISQSLVFFPHPLNFSLRRNLGVLPLLGEGKSKGKKKKFN